MFKKFINLFKKKDKTKISITINGEEFEDITKEELENLFANLNLTLKSSDRESQ